ncbi:hypothetical protein O9993_02600 [Vibrio lentus]|nr:hypothetical protein [Vibrio lentus]
MSHHGGSNNAWTGTEHTRFFDVELNAFETAPRSLQPIFTAPFNEEALDKERQAVDSEYKMKLNDDRDARSSYQRAGKSQSPIFEVFCR